ncbi:Unknown protein [Striga hermonthica]|uniref:Uncharacterized protein n=1 Tax=Striga hermonthica TaxID=68872 RepID=A0A9N7MXX4_STRHE|nr:Unknown protein [Striga hermonthica]
MSIGDSLPPPPAPALDGVPFELWDESDFDQIVSDGFVSICGFGPLLSEREARSVFPNLINFTIARLSGFRAVFAHVSPAFFRLGIAKPETKEISSLSLEPCEGESVVVTTFQILRSDIPAFIETEHEFRFLAVSSVLSVFFRNECPIRASYSDEEYFQHRCKGDKGLYFERFGRYKIRRIWSDDILPCRAYLRQCVMAAEELNEIAYNSFLDHTFLGDRKTTIREYLSTKGLGILDEQPSDS